MFHLAASASDTQVEFKSDKIDPCEGIINSLYDYMIRQHRTENYEYRS